MAENFEKLECCKKCYELKVFIKEKVLVSLPDSKKFDLRSQLLRASRSATANIAEGWGRYHYKENIKFLLNAGFCSWSSRSCDRSLFLELYKIRYLEEIRNTTDSCIKLLNKYIKYLRKQNESRGWWQFRQLTK